ncbi:hypothetical protein AXF42_Ash005374 [Apostasia shenzhenica]|uniref:CCHC-type domain-containing protein n=1 Tax=Apostasia shenzhenica TaxID=1088818 RepID=A0A2I0B6Q3_9ASPA|nr:hypothetical protein AXF42_Ash005374 [Apostasia shenzhenica]
MFTRFTNITNDLISLGKIFTNEKLIRKVLRCLPRDYDAKATAIVEARDLSTLELDMLLGSLTTYELEMKRKRKKNEEDEISSPTASASDTNSSENDEEKLKDEIALISRQFDTLMKKKRHLFRRSQRKSFKNRENKENTLKVKEDDVICYKCNKPGHIKSNCPLLKPRKSKKKKALVATWSDSDESSSSDDKEVVNLCLMADVDINSVNELPLTYDELEENLVDLIHGYEKLKNRYFFLKNTHSSCDSLCKELKKKINDLTLKNNDLSMVVTKVSKKNEMLKSKNIMLEPRCMLRVNNTSYVRNRKHVRNDSLNACQTYGHISSHVICNFCQKHGHVAYTCKIGKVILASKDSFYIWIPKGLSHVDYLTTTNFIGPKFVWVPKTKT